MIKLALRIQNICKAAKISVLTATVISIIMFLAASAMCIAGGSLGFKYLYEQIAVTSADIFSIGIFWGLSGDFFFTIVDRK